LGSEGARERLALQLADAQLGAGCERGNDHVQMSGEALISGGKDEMSCRGCWRMINTHGGVPTVDVTAFSDGLRPFLFLDHESHDE
jgi:hypothetical protein